MQVACNDKLQQQILNEITKREKILRNEYRKLKKESPENQSVLDDYKQYYNQKIDETSQQHLALQQITNYLDTLSEDILLTNEQLNEIKQDQKEVLKKLNLINRELERITKLNSE